MQAAIAPDTIDIVNELNDAALEISEAKDMVMMTWENIFLSLAPPCELEMHRGKSLISAALDRIMEAEQRIEALSSAIYGR